MIKRSITAVFLIAALAAVLLWAPLLWFNVLVLIVIFLAQIEFYRLTFPQNPVYRSLSLVFGTAISAAMIWQGLLVLPVVPLLIIGLFIMCCGLMIYSTVLEGLLSQLGYTCFGILYLSLTLPYFAHIRALPHGRTLIVMAIAMAAMGDTAAYIIGKAFGRHKLAPLVSPNKSIEGFVAGFFGSIVAMGLCRHFMWPEFPLMHAVILAMVIGFVAPMGDLIESLVKRNFHVKDSGSLLPGHGGVLDRADALIFSGPVLFYYVLWVGIV